jgi:hypothetical protein
MQYLRDWVLHRPVIAITAGCVAALVFAAQPASAIGAVPAVHYGETIAPIIQEIGQKGHHGHQYRHHHHYYGYRHYYRPYYGYGYWPDYYYGGYAYRYPYWGRPGLSIGLSF